MIINLNGQSKELTEPITVTELIEQLNLKGPLAVEINKMICPKASHHETQIKPGDTLEIVTIVGGG